MGIKIQCDVEGCDTTHALPGDRMSRGVPPEWARVEMSRDKDYNNDVGKRRASVSKALPGEKNTA